MADLAFLEAQADFAVDLLRETTMNATTSLIMSPISIALALSLAYAGSIGDTRKQFESKFAKGKYFAQFFVINFHISGQSNAALNTFFQNTLTELSSPKNVTLDTANRAYAEKTLTILDSYKELITKSYGGDFALVDFKKAGHQAVKEINSFVSEKTRDKINNLLSDNAVTPDTR
jgi:serpin B